MKPNSFATTIGLILALAVFGGAAQGTDGSAAKASRDWQKHPAIVELDTSETVFAVGDAHGDPERLTGVLAAAKLAESSATAPDKVQWTAGKIGAGGHRRHDRQMDRFPRGDRAAARSAKGRGPPRRAIHYHDGQP